VCHQASTTSVGWLAGWLVGWLVSWSVGWISLSPNKGIRISSRTTGRDRNFIFFFFVATATLFLFCLILRQELVGVFNRRHHAGTEMV
jgi:hypothetical protein